MRRRLLKAVLAGIVCISAFSQTVFAGAWGQKTGHYYVKLTGIYSDADEIFGSSSPSAFRDHSLYFYGEYGVFSHTTLILSNPLFKQSANEANFISGRSRGYLAGDLELQAKFQILEGSIVASILGGVKLPVAYNVIDIPPLGNGETDVDAKLLLGTSLYPIPAYFTGDIGYRLRGGDFVNEIHYNAEAGYTFFKKYLLRFVLNGITGTESASGESNLFGFPLSQEKTRLGGGIIYLLTPHLDIDATFLKSTSGKNIPKSTEIFIGVAFKR